MSGSTCRTHWVTDSLDTDACIMCLRNFIARRGLPQQVISDNGTNMKGADLELKRAVSNIEPNKLKIEFDTVNWKFITPASPHMGGSWERMVQSIKTTL